MPPSPPGHLSDPISSNETETETPIIDAAQAVLRLVQCSRCSRPLHIPLRLPCGNTLCRGCLPPLHRRNGITYPGNEERKQGFTCLSCLRDHCVGDCGTDVLLTRLVEVFDEVLAPPRSSTTTTSSDVAAGGSDLDTPGVDEGGYTLKWKSSGETHTATVEGGGGLLGCIYALVREGRFGFNATEIRGEGYGRLDQGKTTAASFARLKNAIRNELDCHVCYSMILDPLTTTCGHTFCQGCVAMVLDHSDLCPVCRRKLNLASTVHSEPINRRVSELMENLFPDEVAARREASIRDGTNLSETTLPLFVSALSLPTMPTFLHIFEPRYRLMIRRVMQTQGRKFGMVMYNRAGRIQEGLGRSPFLRYGTVLVVDRCEVLPDGRSLVVATGTSRFKVVSSEVVDGYHVGRVQRIDDLSITEEESREAAETSAAVDSNPPPMTSLERPLETMSTQDLLQISLDFVRRQQGQGAPWLRPRTLLAYGNVPIDPAQFPWWFASVLPVWEEEKYALLSAPSVRERLKITARWVRKLESRNCRPSPRLCPYPSDSGDRDNRIHAVVIKRVYCVYTILHVGLCLLWLWLSVQRNGCPGGPVFFKWRPRIQDNPSYALIAPAS
ncbi:LON peptidase N-terminal domain and RING finger protein 3 [Aspergillus nanangensis]|uniref:LON peptidase N-terminal domain and RING finger protein 3 n=1 Tax=Aspergillus nanangensis TaxID=2582783 RepID=A0AAD4GRT2_ASPNN|nr:LON peptidase N-terminal domain and RING finger protein 3 [Aspergillus nanangensis]